MPNQIPDNPYEVDYVAVEDTLLDVGAAEGALAGADNPFLTVKEGWQRTDSGGLILFQTDGSFIYTSAAGFAGIDTVTFTVIDAGVEAGTDTLKIEVEAEAHLPFVSAGTQLSEWHVLESGPGMIGNGIFTDGRLLTPLPDGGYVLAIGYQDQAYGSTLEFRRYDLDHNQVGPSFDPGPVSGVRCTALPGGGYVVAWNNYDETQESTAHLQVFDSQAAAVGAPIDLDVAGGLDFISTVAALPGGGFVVIALEAPAQLHAQVFKADGTPDGDLFALGSTDQFRGPAVLPSGEIVLHRLENDNDLYLQRFDTQGNPIGPEVLVPDGDDVAIDSNTVSFTPLANGNIAISWASYLEPSPPDPAFRFYTQIIDADGEFVAPLATHDTEVTTIFGVPRPQVIALANGGFLVHWRGTVDENDNIQFTGQVYDADGNAVGGTIVFDAYPPTGILRIIALEDGGFAVAPQTAIAGDSNAALQIYDNNGVRVGDVRLEDVGDGARAFPSLARLASGEILVLLSEDHPDFGTSRVTVQTLDIGIGSETPVVESGASFNEDTTGTVAFVVSMPDQDGSEIVESLVIGGVPAGWIVAYPGATASFDGGSGLWTITGALIAPAGAVQLLLRAPADYNGTITLTVTAHTRDTVNDDTSESLPVSIEVTVKPMPEAPQVDLDGSASGTGHAGVFVEDGPAVPVADADLSITDADSATLVSARITLTNHKPGDELLLSGPLPAGIAASAYDPETGVLTLTGPASPAAYEAALALVSFRNTSDTPDTADRLVEITVSDGDQDSPVATATIEVVGVVDPRVAVSDVTVVEGNDGTVGAVFTVTRTGDLAPFSVSYATADGTALAGEDYLAAGGTLVFGQGEVSKSIVVDVTGDFDLEADEQFLLDLFNPTGGAVLADAEGVATIANDDTNPSRLAISPVNVAEIEGDDGSVTFLFTVTRGGNTQRSASAEWKISGATEATSSDFAPGQPLSGTVGFAAGETVKTIAVKVAGDTAIEPDEHFAVTLSDPSAGTVITRAQATGTIVSDDTSLAIEATDAHKAEGDAGTTGFVFTVTRVGGTEGELTASYAVEGALPGDFGGTRPTGEIVFASGESERQIVIEVTGDTVAEADQPFTVTLTDDGGNVLAIGHGVIENDDPAFFDAALAGPILRLYQAVLGRLPDPDGLAFWIDQFANGRPLIELAGDFVDSDEFRDQHGNVTDGSDPDFIATLYTNVLGRDPDPDGFDFWTGLDDPDPAAIVLLFSQSDEYVARTGPAIEDFLAEAEAGTQDYRGHLLDTNDDGIVDDHDLGATLPLAAAPDFTDAVM